MTRILFPAIMILLLITSEVNAQDPHFSQFYMSPLTLNPAVTGMFNAKARFTANYRNQWASVTVPYQTFSASGEGSFFREQLGGDYAGFGLIALNDVAGDSKFCGGRSICSLATPGFRLVPSHRQDWRLVF